jgi:ribonuclease P protein component
VALPQAHRLKHWRIFKAVHEQGTRYASRWLTVIKLPQWGERSPTKFGVSISQKVSKKAVIRNRIKRQILAVIQQMLPYFYPGWWVVVVVKPAALGCNYQDFLRELKQLLIKAEMLHGY